MPRFPLIPLGRAVSRLPRPRYTFRSARRRCRERNAWLGLGGCQNRDDVSVRSLLGLASLPTEVRGEGRLLNLRVGIESVELQASGSRTRRIPPPSTFLRTSNPSISSPRPTTTTSSPQRVLPSARRLFHNYFITHLPTSSMHPDRRNFGPGHKLPRDASIPHTPAGPGAQHPAISPPNMPTRDLTVVRIPLQKAKHHFGAATARGTRPYNEDTYQAGTVELPAFAKRPPISLVRRAPKPDPGEATPADGMFGDPQVFYFGVFDGHGGSECAEFLRDELHGYIEQAAGRLSLPSSLGTEKPATWGQEGPSNSEAESHEAGFNTHGHHHDTPLPTRYIRELVNEYRNTIGGYFRRFQPDHLNEDIPSPNEPTSLPAALSYAFLRADLDFVTAQAHKPDPSDPTSGDYPLNDDEILGTPHQRRTPSGHRIGGPLRFTGGSTASIALISTPTPAPFWHPSAAATLAIAHVGDTRILLCETATGLSRRLTPDHHPDTPIESRRLRRYAPLAVTADSFGERRLNGLANSRSFGDMRSKRIGVSSEPSIEILHFHPAEYAFLVLATDGVTNTLSDQEVVDVVKEARTPEQGARDVADYATEVSVDGDNATCLVVRLGGWERRSEGGLGSLGTKEVRDLRRAEALDPRGRKR